MVVRLLHLLELALKVHMLPGCLFVFLLTQCFMPTLVMFYRLATFFNQFLQFCYPPFMMFLDLLDVNFLLRVVDRATDKAVHDETVDVSQDIAKPRVARFI